MSEENISQVDEKCCLDDAKPMEISRDDVLVPSGETDHVSSRRFSTGTLGGKAQVQTRYRGNQTSSTHDLCKHGKRREEDLVMKPWKLVKKKNVETGEALGNVSKPDKSPLRVVKKQDASTCPSVSAVVRTVKKTNLDVKKVSRISGNQSCKEELLKNKEKKKIDEPEICDDSLEKTSLDVKEVENKDSEEELLKIKEKKNLDVKKVSRISGNQSSKEELLKNKEKTKIDEPEKCEDSMEKINVDVKELENKDSKQELLKIKEKTNLDVKKVSRISEKKSLKEDRLKKNKEKVKINEPDDALEKTLYVVEASIEKKKKTTSVKSEIQQSAEKKILRGSGKKGLSLIPTLSPSSVKESRVTRSDPRPIRQTTSKSKTTLSGSANLVTNPKTESKIIKPKRIGLKITPPLPTKELKSFKKGKVLEQKPEDSTPTLIKFKKRVVQEPKLRTDVNKKKKNLKDKRDSGVGKINGEGKREKVVLRHRKVEVKKKLQTLFNNVIEETVNKLEEVRKSKVKALVGAFETVISLQDNDGRTTSQKKKIQSKPTSSLAVEG